MVSVYQLAFVAFFTTHLTINAEKHSSEPTFNRFKFRHTKINKDVLQKWEFELDDKLDYPRGDKEKLRKISAQWSDYYACSSQLARSANAAAAVAVAVYEGAVARLPCGLCVAPGTSDVRWLHQKPQSSSSQLDIDERMIISDTGNLSIFKVRVEDGGFYKCTIGHSTGGVVLLDVVDRSEPYDVVKPTTSNGPYPTSNQTIRVDGSSLTLFSSWALWSECSACDRVGRRRQHGMCYVKMSHGWPKKEARKYELSTKSIGSNFKAQNQLRVFRDFPAGIPCRSRLLPQRIRNAPAVAERRNEIMIGLCKVSCEKASVFEVCSSDGAVLERANNSAGVFSLSQRLPTPPPAPARETIFAIRGQRVVLICPGTSLQDVPVTWRVGTKKLSPRESDRGSGGRVHLNARDDIVFTALLYEDANLYSCWHRDILVGAVKLTVWDTCPWQRHATLVAILVVVALIARALDNVLQRRRRRCGVS